MVRKTQRPRRRRQRGGVEDLNNTSLFSDTEGDPIPVNLTENQAPLEPSSSRRNSTIADTSEVPETPPPRQGSIANIDEGDTNQDNEVDPIQVNLTDDQGLTESAISRSNSTIADRNEVPETSHSRQGSIANIDEVNPTVDDQPRRKMNFPPRPLMPLRRSNSISVISDADPSRSNSISVISDADPSLPGTNQELLNNITNELNNVVGDLKDKSKIIDHLKQLYQKLQEEKQDLYNQLSNRNSESAKLQVQYQRKRDENEQLNKKQLEDKKKEEELNQKIKEVDNYIKNVQKLVDTQSSSLLALTGGSKSKKKSPKMVLDKVKILNKVSREDLDKLAKKWKVKNIYKKKKDLQNALKLVYLMSLLKLEKRNKYELTQLAKNFNTKGKTKKDLLPELKAKMKSIRL